jgi:hypothetical protein
VEADAIPSAAPHQVIHDLRLHLSPVWTVQGTTIFDPFCDRPLQLTRFSNAVNCGNYVFDVIIFDDILLHIGTALPGDPPYRWCRGHGFFDLTVRFC